MLELPPSSADAGRRAFFDAEQLRLEERFDERRAVDGNKRSVATPADLVDLAGDQLLPYATFAFQEHREIGSGQPLDRRAQCLHDVGGSNERRRAVAPASMTIDEACPRELRPRPLDFEHERADVRGGAEHLKIPLPEMAAGIERRLEKATRGGISTGDFERNGLDAIRATEVSGPSTARLPELNGSNGHDALQRFLERRAHLRDVLSLVEKPGERSEQFAERLTTIALTRDVDGRSRRRPVRV